MAPHRARTANSVTSDGLGELNELLWALPTSLDPGEIAAALLERATRMFRSPLAALWFTRDGEPELIGSFGLTDKKAEQLWAGLDLDATAVPLNLYADRLAGAGAFGKRRLGALLATPLRTDGGPLGWLVFARLEADPYTAFEDELVGIIATRIALALENARLYQRTEARSRDMALLADCAALLMSTTRLQDLLDAIARRVVEAFGLTFASIQLLDPASGTLPPTAVFHRDPEQAGRLEAWFGNRPLRQNEGITSRIFKTRRPYLTPNLAEDPVTTPDVRAQLGPGSCLVLPLLVRGEPVGAMYWFKGGRAGALAEDLIPLASQLAGQIAMAVENARLYEALSRRAADGDSRLQTISEDVAARLTEARRFAAELGRDLRGDLASLADAARRCGPDEGVEGAIARMADRLDELDRRLAEGERRPF